MRLNQKKGFAIVLMIFSPVVSLVYSLRNLNYRGKQLIFTLFGLVYGLSLNFSEGSDAGAYVRNLGTYYGVGLGEFVERFIGIISFNPPPGSPSDLYLHFLNGIAGSLFQSPILLYAIVGTVYGYLYGTALLGVIKLPKGRNITLLLVILVGLFVIHRGYENMQTIRSWTGMWVLFNGVLGYFQTKKRKYIILVLLSPMFHLMYSFIAIPALIVILFQSIPRKVVIAVYLISFVASVNTSSVVNIASENELSKRKLGSYYRIDSDGEEIDPIEKRLEESNAVWYAKYGKTDSVYYGSTYFIFFLILAGYYRKSKMTELEYGVLSIGILLASLANYLSFAYALYSRTMANASLYVLAVMVFLILRDGFILNKEPIWKRIGLWIGILIFVPKVVYFMSSFIQFTSMMILAFPFLNFFGDSSNFSIRDFINVFL